MQLTFSEKINPRIFLPLSLLTTGITCWFANSFQELAIIWTVYGAILLNLFMTYMAVKGLFFSNKVDKSRIIFYSLGKITILFAIMGLGAMVMKKRIVIVIANYVMQIFILAVSFLKRRD